MGDSRLLTVMQKTVAEYVGGGSNDDDDDNNSNVRDDPEYCNRPEVIC